MGKFTTKEHEAKGYSGRKVGFGEKPALLLIDFQKGITADDAPVTSKLVQDATNNTIPLLAAARNKNVPIFQTVTAFREDLSDVGMWKMTSIFKWTEGSKWAEVDDRLKERDNEIVITKKAGSAFKGTPLLNYLITRGVDTILLTGLNTSGCIRATANDCHAYGYRCNIPAECVGDVTGEDAECPAHKQNLIDLNARYCDVVSLKDVLEYLEGL